MQILTDYQQWYDAVFDGHCPVFHRTAFTRGGLSKRAQFQLFHTLGLPTPRHGSVSDLAQHLSHPLTGLRAPASVLEEIRCIVYHDEFAHRGEGKELLPLSAALEQFPTQFASLYHASSTGAVAFRLARLGQLVFWLRQESAVSDWRSNRQERETVLSREVAIEPNPIPRVLWAIDFILGPEGLLAVDFNTAPDLTTLGETDALSPPDVLAELNRAAQENPDALRQF
jgi:hypothetical protein